MTDTRRAGPPQATDAEMALLGCFIVQPMTVDEVATLVGPEDFFAERNRVTCEALLRLHAQCQPIGDPVVLKHELKRIGRYEDFGGRGFINDLMSYVPNGPHAAFYAKQVRDAADRRRLLEACVGVFKNVQDPGVTVGECVETLSGHLDSILERTSGNDVVSAHSSYAEFLEDIDKDESNAVSTGWNHLDELLLGGLRAGQLVVLAARPSVGKTSFATTLALKMSLEGASSLFCSLEMKCKELIARYASALSGVPHILISKHDLTKEQRHRLIEAGNKVAGMKMGIDHSSHRTIRQIAAASRLWKRQRGLDVLIVDYLQLVSPEDSRANREQQVASMSRGLKGLAQDLNVPVVCLAQLSREIEKRDVKRPRLSDLRESGAIEQDADLVIFLDRPWTYSKEANPTEANIIIAKNRSGPTGEVKMYWHAATMSFREPQNDSHNNLF